MWYNSFLSARIQLSRAQRRHLSTGLRLASRALMKGKRGGVGQLGNGASVAAVLSALGVITFSGPAHGQFAAGGATALPSASVDVMGDRITGGTLVFPGGNTSTTPTGVAVGDVSSKAISGSVVFGFHDVAGVSGQFPGVALGIENQAFGTFAVAVERRTMRPALTLLLLASTLQPAAASRWARAVRQ